MNNIDLQSILLETVKQKTIINLLFIGLALLVLVSGILRRKKMKKTDSKKLKRIMCEIMLSIVLLIGTPVLFFPWVLDAIRDMKHQQFVQITAMYERNATSIPRNGWHTNGYVWVYADDIKIRLELPADWTEEQFPYGKEEGTIWYSKESKVILAIQTEKAR